MKRINVLTMVFSLLLCVITGHAQPKYPVLREPQAEDVIINQLSEEFMPVIGVWVLKESELEPDGFKRIIDQASMNSPFNLLIPHLRYPDKEVVDDEVYRAVKNAAGYAVRNNIALVPDLDIRNARRAFQKQYPDELQELLRLQEVSLSEDGVTETSLTSIRNLSDHYSGGNIPKYYPVKSSLLRVYAYRGSSEGIEKETLKDITGECSTVYSSEDSVRISIPRQDDNSTHACVMVSFTLFYPDIFAPHLMEFQREVIRQYADVPLAGVCKDEWGFPPYFPEYVLEDIYDFWYSAHRAAEYARRTGGRDLLADCLMMAKGFKGKEVERQMAINHFMEMSLQRNVAVENDFYDAVKEVFGPYAAVTVHPTWWPYPDKQEMKKNGLDWWGVKRDWAQTDEIVPFGARTALCKKWGSPVWYNQYYSKVFEDQVWSSALAGGRIDYLPFQRLYDADLMRAETRIRLLNAISRSPLDCPVAVIFGHAAAMNWAGPYFNDVGMELVNLFWNTGYPADLIPTSEIENGSLRIDEDGWVTYGEQRYAAVVLYHPEFEKRSTSDFFLKAGRSRTAMFRIGEWTKDFYGEALESNRLLPNTMIVENDYRDAYLKIMEVFRNLNITVQTPATEDLDEKYFSLGDDFKEVSKFPPTTGFCRLIDGTVIHVAGTDEVSGDPIAAVFEISGHPVTFDAIGVAAVRLDGNGEVQALAAGSLKFFKAGDFEINLDERLDIALWIDENGQWKGLIQGLKGEIPAVLRRITGNWEQVGLPEPPANRAGQFN
jgi:hypothetical protein